MKQTYIFLLLISLLISCESKKTVEINQIKSNEMVTISYNTKKVKDSFQMCVPLEFEIKINSPIHYVNWFYSENNKFLENGFDYLVYNKLNKSKPLYQLDFNESIPKDRIVIILKRRNLLVSKKDALNLLKKYNVTKSLDNLKLGDTIKLETYNKFRKENQSIINNFSRINDSIKIRGMIEDGSFFYDKKKINW